MAIIRLINDNKETGRKALLAALEYVANPEKNDDTIAKMEDFKRQTYANRVLCGKKKRKRHYKHIVVSMKEEWPSDDTGRKNYDIALRNVAYNFVIYFMEKGFIAEAWSHHNTKHPHFHLLLETCNANTAKQYSQSLEDLAEMKVALNRELKKYMFGELIVGEVEEISEEELLLEGENDFYERTIDWFEEPYEGNYEVFYSTDDWNIGTVEQPMREMVKIVPPEQKKQGREMVKIVTPEEKERAKNVAPEGKEMVKIVTEEQKKNANDHLEKVAAFMRHARYKKN